MKFVIGQRVPTPRKHTNVFQLQIDAMSGDGDHHEKSSIYGDEAKIAEKIKLLNAASELDWNSRCDESEVQDAIEDRAIEMGLDPTACSNWLSDMLGRDITCEGRAAFLYGVKVFWLDENGDQYNVEVEGLIDPR